MEIITAGKDPKNKMQKYQKGMVIIMLKNLKNVYMYLLTMACAIAMLAGCAAAPAVTVPVATTPAPVVTETDPVVSATPEGTTPVNDNMDDTEDAPVETIIGMPGSCLLWHKA